LPTITTMTIRLANPRLAAFPYLAGQFRVAQAAGVSSAIQLTGSYLTRAGLNPDSRRSGF